MWIDVFKRLIFSDNPSVIEWKVKDALENGEDLCASPFVFNGHFCQWVTQRESMYEYKLVTAHLPSEFEDWVKRYTAEGYELAFEPVNWDGMICQWMAKVRLPKGLELESAVAVAGGGVSITPVLKMVERVQFLGEFSFSKFSYGRAR